MEDALGLGDVKFMGACGLFLGLENILLALSLGAMLGIFHGFLLQYYIKKSTGKAPDISRINVPAGVGLAIGVILVSFYGFGFWWQKI
jgi:leader peptidase (prepilin peptidase)/N-methyltransferase